MKWETFTFAQPWLLLLLLALPVLAIWRGARGAAPAVVYSSLEPVRTLGRPRRAKAGGWLLTLLLLALGSLIVALARPQMGRTLTHTEASGIDIMLALDVSPSMLAEDFTIGGERVNRLEAVKKVTEEFIAARPNDRIGIVAFAGRPYLVSPLTLDHDWLLQNLERLKIGLVENGTAIGSAIASSANRLRDRESKSRIVVLLTDGDNNAGKISPATAAEAARALGIKVYAIGAGTRGFAPMPVPFGGRTIYQNVQVNVDEETLQQIAKLTDAQYYRATDTKSLAQIFEAIDKLEKSTVELSQYKEVRELFPWFVGAGGALLGLHLLLGLTVWRRVP
jgi:Ca-activated chloride channel family protein